MDETEELIKEYEARLSKERDKALSWKESAEGLAKMVEILTERLRKRDSTT